MIIKPSQIQCKGSLYKFHTHTDTKDWSVIIEVIYYCTFIT